MDTPETHPVLGGKAYLYKRPDSKELSNICRDDREALCSASQKLT